MMTYDLTEASKILKMSVSALRDKAARGMVPGSKPGKKWVFEEDDLKRYLHRLSEEKKHQAETNETLEKRASRKCHYTKEKAYGGSMCGIMDAEYANLLLHR